ncbi:mitotic-spindle organizing protein 1 [Cricetulus griseus]|uniref:Mitotic-spindle organizing protein 1 n=1 Tax=Cricetulus griseus TaxID=10029 RepID=A0A061IMK2_CRIGR|nr:mitotic-spindle organizing protein 1 [Cricetulus griseus]
MCKPWLSLYKIQLELRGLLWAFRVRQSVLLEISRILNTGLDMETLSICVRLCEQGINPEALSSVIKELRKGTEALKAAENTS